MGNLPSFEWKRPATTKSRIFQEIPHHKKTYIQAMESRDRYIKTIANFSSESVSNPVHGQKDQIV